MPYFKDDFHNPEILRTYISDWTTYQKIIERYEQKSSDEKLFMFDVTMQNHGSYVKRYSNLYRMSVSWAAKGPI